MIRRKGEGMKAIFRYPGAKWTIAPWIIEHFPAGYEEMIYLEPFAGSLAVFFNKQPGKIEVVNDLDGEIVNFFYVLRDRTDELERAIELTPYSREEYDRAFEVCEDPVERARRFMIIANMGVGAKRATKSGWQCSVSEDPGGCVVKWSSVMDVIKIAAKRLRGTSTNLVYIENKDALELINRFDRENVLMYVDPPYVRKTRKSGELYKYEMDDMHHLELVQALAKTKAKIVLSGYDCELYNQYLQGWHKDRIQARMTVGTGTETIWMNYEPMYQNILEDLEHGAGDFVI